MYLVANCYSLLSQGHLATVWPGQYECNNSIFIQFALAIAGWNQIEFNKQYDKWWQFLSNCLFAVQLGCPMLSGTAWSQDAGAAGDVRSASIPQFNTLYTLSLSSWTCPHCHVAASERHHCSQSLWFHIRKRLVQGIARGQDLTASRKHHGTSLLWYLWWLKERLSCPFGCGCLRFHCLCRYVRVYYA